MKKIITLLFTVALLGGMSTANAVPPEQEIAGPFFVTGDLVAECNDFNVLNNNKWVIVTTSFFDKSGDVVRYKEVVGYRDSVYYNSENPEIKLMGGPVEKLVFRDNGGNLLVQFEHDYMVKLPKGGGVFMDARRLVFDLNTFELTMVGRSDSDDQDAIDRLCAAFAGP